MKAAGVPIVPGTTERLTDERVREVAGELGFPVMVKASAGGGGKGLRLVRTAAELDAALKRARSEAKSAFGDDGIYLEKFVLGPRHVEIQFMADAHGTVLHLFERECSIQRRHQKLIEEAPANRMTPLLREKMGAAAIAAAKAVGYVGAGTCEFLVDAERQLLLPRDEHARAGRARRHGARHRDRHREGRHPRRRRRAARLRAVRRGPVRLGARVPDLRRGSGQELPALAGDDQRVPAARGPGSARRLRRVSRRAGHGLLRSADREALRLGPRPPRGDRAHAPRARRVRDRGQ